MSKLVKMDSKMIWNLSSLNYRIGSAVVKETRQFAAVQKGIHISELSLWTNTHYNPFYFLRCRLLLHATMLLWISFFLLVLISWLYLNMLLGFIEMHAGFLLKIEVKQLDVTMSTVHSYMNHSFGFFVIFA